MSLLATRLLRTQHVLARTPSLRLALFALLALAVSWTALGQAGGLNDFRDSHLHHSYEEAAVRTLVDYHQLPLWNPWTCGGVEAVGSPQTRLASPTLLLSALVGARRAEPLLLFLFLLLGLEGSFRYARLKAGSAAGALLVAPLYALNGYHAISWSNGWVSFLGFELLPWALVGTAWAVRGRAVGLAVLAASFALMLGFGGSYPVPLCALLVAFEGVALLLSPRQQGRRGAALALLSAGALLTVGACLFRLWPMLETLHDAPRVMAGKPAKGLSEVLSMLWTWPPPPQKAGGSEGIFYLAPLAVLPALLAVLLAPRRARLPLVGLGLAAWLATGYALRPSLFALLRELPIFGTLRYPERFLLPASLFLTALAALGLGVLLAKARREARWAWLPLAVGLLGLAGWGVQGAAFERVSRRVTLVPMPQRVEQPFAQARGNRWLQGHVMALNRGSLSCGEGYALPMSPRLSGNLPQEEFLEEAGAGRVVRRAWTPNRLELEVEAARPVHLLVNQNYHPGWKASVGEVVSREGLLAVRLPAGTHHVTLRFLPRAPLGGALVSLVTFGVLGALVWRGGRVRPRVALLAAVLPLGVWGAVLLAWSEVKAPSLLANPDGTPLHVEEVPADAVAVGARFGVPVELVAARVPPGPQADGQVPLELYWRVTDAVPRSVGIWVHVSGPAGSTRRSGDHEVVGGTWFLRDAPRGTLLRDAFAVHVDDTHPGRWTVSVGLWHASGDGSRVPAIGPGGAALPDGRVEVGHFTVSPKAEATR